MTKNVGLTFSVLRRKLTYVMARPPRPWERKCAHLYSRTQYELGWIFEVAISYLYCPCVWTGLQCTESQPSGSNLTFIISNPLQPSQSISTQICVEDEHVHRFKREGIIAYKCTSHLTNVKPWSTPSRFVLDSYQMTRTRLFQGFWGQLWCRIN